MAFKWARPPAPPEGLGAAQRTQIENDVRELVRKALAAYMAANFGL